MRKVINGKLYDTDKAHRIAYWRNGWGGRDYFSTALYRKRTGEYFVCEQYSEYDFEEFIRPLTYDMAKVWVEDYADADVYEAEFGIPDEGAEHDLHAIISEAAWQAMSRAAANDGVTIRAVIERLAATL